MEGKLRCTQIPKYTGVLIKLLQWCQYGVVDPIHDMVEVEPWQTLVTKNLKFFTEERIFSLAHIIKVAHVVPTTAAPVQY